MKNKLDAESSDGPMKLLFVSKSVLRIQRGNGPSVYMILFKGGARLAATNYHAFCGIRDSKQIVIKASEVQSGDKIWIDSESSDLFIPSQRASYIDENHKVLTRYGWK